MLVHPLNQFRGKLDQGARKSYQLPKNAPREHHADAEKAQTISESLHR
jgi:hypothetical protein